MKSSISCGTTFFMVFMKFFGLVFRVDISIIEVDSKKINNESKNVYN
jgi:hypothetical protein